MRIKYLPKTIKLTHISLMAALLCILSPISIPLAFTPVPITLGLFAIYISAYILEPIDALICFCIYLLMGFLGLPVFSGYRGGIFVLLGPTAGYLFGFIPTIYICSYINHKFSTSRTLQVFGMLAGLLSCYIIGTYWFSAQLEKSFLESLALCVFPFIPGDLIKIFLTSIIAPEIIKRI